LKVFLKDKNITNLVINGRSYEVKDGVVEISPEDFRVLKAKEAFVIEKVINDDFQVESIGDTPIPEPPKKHKKK